MTGDQKPELIVPNSNAGNISIFKNNSTRKKIILDTRTEIITGMLPLNIAVGDIDGDAKPDIAVCNFSIFVNNISVLKNTQTNGEISFAAKVDFPTANTPRGILLNDLDADGRPDLISSNSTVNFISVLKNLVPLNGFTSVSSISSIVADNSLIKVQPNPSKGVFNVALNLPSKKLPTTFALYNNEGRKVWQQYMGELSAGASKTVIVQSKPVAGFYILRIERADTTIVSKIIIVD